MKQLMRLLAGAILLCSCSEKQTDVMGYAPVYGDVDEYNDISLRSPQAVEQGGKIYVLGNYLFQVEQGKGIHVNDISKPATPLRKGFVNVPGAKEIAVKDGLIYTNNDNDLVAIKVEGEKAVVVKRIASSFGYRDRNLPPEPGPFECPDKTKGTVIGWQKKKLTNPSCSY